MSRIEELERQLEAVNRAESELRTICCETGVIL